jgi:hypothetical protein
VYIHAKEFYNWGYNVYAIKLNLESLGLTKQGFYSLPFLACGAGWNKMQFTRVSTQLLWPDACIKWRDVLSFALLLCLFFSFVSLIYYMQTLSFPLSSFLCFLQNTNWEYQWVDLHIGSGNRGVQSCGWWGSKYTATYWAYDSERTCFLIRRSVDRQWAHKSATQWHRALQNTNETIRRCERQRILLLLILVQRSERFAALWVSVCRKHKQLNDMADAISVNPSHLIIRSLSHQWL